MYSPSKSYSYQTQPQPQNIASFKQETLLLLRQQSQKMKQLQAFLSTKDEELMIKDEQVKFLKQTIRDLEEESQVLIQEKNQLKQKLQKIVQEVKNYNQKVVRPICEQKEQYKKANGSLKTINEELQKALTQMKALFKQSDTTIKSLSEELEYAKSIVKEHQMKNLQLQKHLQRQTSTNSQQISQIQKLTSKLNIESSLKQKLQTEVSSLNKQLNSVINKHNSSTKEYEHKMREIQNSKIDKSEVAVYEGLVKQKQGQIVDLNCKLSALARSVEEIRHKYLSQKQKLTKENTELKLYLTELMTDLTNLKKSFQLQKRIIEFESPQSDIFYSLYEQYESLIEQSSQFHEEQENLLNNQSKLQREVDKLSQKLKDTEIEETLMKTQLHEELERLESTYEGKLVSLNLKIRKEQQALDKLQKRQLEAMEQKEKLSHSLESIQQDFHAYKQTTQKSLQRLNNENYRIASEMQQLYKICEENVDSKRIVDKLKYILHALLITLYYMQMKILRSKEKQRKIYVPFIFAFSNLTKKLDELSEFRQEIGDNQNSQKQEKLSFLTISSKSKSNKNKTFQRRNEGIRKFKKCAWVVIASLRMQKCLENVGESQKFSNLSSIQLKLLKALNTRNKFHSMAQLMQKQSQIYSKSEQNEEILCNLLKVTEKAFTWPESNFKSLYIDFHKHSLVLQRIKQGIVQTKN